MSLGRRLLDSFFVLFAVFAIGVIGFKSFGGPEDSWVKAAYMAVITLTTVGYGEATSINTNSAMVFAMLYALTGMGVLLYALATATAFVVEGEAKRLYWQRRVRKMVERMSNHYIVCGVGRQGRVIADEFYKTGRQFVMIEGQEDRADELKQAMPDMPVIHGDATDNDVLLSAGIEKAHGLIACLADDRDNLLLTVTVKQINPDVRIVCKVMDVKDMMKLNRAGADKVVSPTLIGGLRMASEMIRPSVVSFLDIMLRDKDHVLRVEDVRVPMGSKAAGKTLGDLDVNHRAGMVVVATQQPGSDKFEYAPTGEVRIVEDMVLVLIGDVRNLPKVAALVA